MEYYYGAQWINAAVVSTVLTLRVPYNGRRQRCHAIKGDGRLEVKLHPFLTSAVGFVCVWEGVIHVLVSFNPR